MKQLYFQQNDSSFIRLHVNDDAAERQRCFNLGINEFFHKPFNPIQLREKIQSVFVQAEQPLKESFQPNASFLKLAAG